MRRLGGLSLLRQTSRLRHHRRHTWGSTLTVPTTTRTATTAAGTETPRPPQRILFFGSDELSITCLDALLALEAPERLLVDVVCPPDRAIGKKGRASAGGSRAGVPLKRHAQRLGLEVFQPKEVPRGSPMKKWSVPTWETRDLPRYDLAVVVSFGYFLPPHVLDVFPLGALNVHPSLLPRYRGPAPMHHALINGDAETGVSIIDLDRRTFDAGRVFLQARHEIAPDATYSRLHRELSELGALCLQHVVGNHVEVVQAGTGTLVGVGKQMRRWQESAAAGGGGEGGIRGELELELVQEDAIGGESAELDIVTHAPKLGLEDGVLRFAHSAGGEEEEGKRVPMDMSAIGIYNRWRALGEGVGVRCSFQRAGGNKTVDLLLRSVRLAEGEEGEAGGHRQALEQRPGCLTYDHAARCLRLSCEDGGTLLCERVQVAGKKETTAEAFANGHGLRKSATPIFLD